MSFFFSAIMQSEGPPKYNYVALGNDINIAHYLIYSLQWQSNQISLEHSDDDGDDSDASDGGSRLSLTTPSQCSMQSNGFTNYPLKRPSDYPRNAKERFLHLLKKLSKLAEFVENTSVFTKLSAGLVSVMMTAKPMIPKETFSKIYTEEPRPLLHPRRTRKSQSVVGTDEALL